MGYETHVELSRVSLSNRLALINQLIKEQEPPEPVFPHKPGQAHEGEGGDAAQRQLHDSVEGPRVLAVAGGAGQQEMGNRGHDDREEDEHGPRQTCCPNIRLVHAHPSEIGSETLQLVLRMRDAACEFCVPAYQCLS